MNYTWHRGTVVLDIKKGELFVIVSCEYELIHLMSLSDSEVDCFVLRHGFKVGNLIPV